MQTRSCLLACMLLVACGGNTSHPPADGSSNGPDGAMQSDVSTDATDAMTPSDAANDARDVVMPSDGATDAHDVVTMPTDAGQPPVGLAARQRAFAAAVRPGSPPHFLIGLGNDLANNHNMDGAYTLGTTLDLHYAYLVGLSNAGGWVTWNAGGSFPDVLDAAAVTHHTTSMYTFYILGIPFESAQNPIQDAATMDVYWHDLKLLATRLGALGHPFVVHHEPDSWGYIEQHVEQAHQTPDTYMARLHTANFHDCDDLPETVHGFGRCFVRLFRTNAPMVKIGMHASEWAAGNATQIADFLLASGADETDFIVTDPLDRDAGYWETHHWDGASNSFVTNACTVTMGPRGHVYMDETTATQPNYADYLTWVRTLSGRMQLPVMFWQVPLGVPSDTCGGPGGGSDGHYRDNHVHYFFAHISELVAAGGVGAVFGTGAGGQTYIDSDGNQFHDAVNAYFTSPYLLP